VATIIDIEDRGRVRLLTLNRPDALNAFSDALYDAATDALLDAAAARGVAVVVFTGAGRAFSAGADLGEMARRNAGAVITSRHGFGGYVDQLMSFPKPIVCAVNGLAVGIGATMLALSDLVFVSTDAKVRCPFTRLGVAPEAASSVTFPWLMGRQNATWALMSSEWLSPEECLRMGLAWRVCAPGELLDEAMRHAQVLAAKPISSLIETKRTIVEPWLPQMAVARQRENAAFGRLLGQPANAEALRAFAERREPDFASVDD